jgi:hypothetical protein
MYISGALKCAPLRQQCHKKSKIEAQILLVSKMDNTNNQNTPTGIVYLLIKCPCCEALLKIGLTNGRVIVLENKIQLNGCHQDRKQT